MGTRGTDWDIVRSNGYLYSPKSQHKQYNKGNKEARASAATNRPDKISPQQPGMTLQGHVWHVVYPEGAEQTPGRVSAYITCSYLCVLTQKPDTPAFCGRKTGKNFIWESVSLGPYYSITKHVDWPTDKLMVFRIGGRCDFTTRAPGTQRRLKLTCPSRKSCDRTGPSNYEGITVSAEEYSHLTYVPSTISHRRSAF